MEEVNGGQEYPFPSCMNDGDIQMDGTEEEKNWQGKKVMVEYQERQQGIMPLGIWRVKKLEACYGNSFDGNSVGKGVVVCTEEVTGITAFLIGVIERQAHFFGVIMA